MAAEAHISDVADLATAALAICRPGGQIYETAASPVFEESLKTFDGVMQFSVDSDDLRADVAALGAFVLAFEAAVVAVEYVDQGYDFDDPDRSAIYEIAAENLVDFEVLYIGQGSIVSRIKVVARNIDPRTKEGRRKLLLVVTVATSVLALIITPVPLVIAGGLTSLNELIPERVEQHGPVSLASADVAPLAGRAIEIAAEAA